MSDDFRVENLSKFLRTMLDYGDGDFAVALTLKKNGTVHDFAMVAIKPKSEGTSTWKGRPLAPKLPPET